MANRAPRTLDSMAFVIDFADFVPHHVLFEIFAPKKQRSQSAVDKKVKQLPSI